MTDMNDARLQMTFQAQKKSTGVAYLLWFFLGGLGAHRFYLGQTGTAIAQLVLFVLGWLTVIIFIGVLLLAAVGIWLIVDAFLIPGMIEQKNMTLVDSLMGGGGNSSQRTPASLAGDPRRTEI
jgi:TM2 domain-containing membrane protein YozV